MTYFTKRPKPQKPYPDLPTSRLPTSRLPTSRDFSHAMGVWAKEIRVLDREVIACRERRASAAELRRLQDGIPPRRAALGRNRPV